MSTDGRLPLPEFVKYPIFPFEGEMQVKELKPSYLGDRPREGEDGPDSCHTCSRADDEYIWVDEHWRVSAGNRSGIPIQLFLETREHVDMDELTGERSAELGGLIVRLDRAVQAIGGIGRVHVSRWGDGAAHFHMWFFGRPVGASQMLGFGLPMWAMTLPTVEAEVWDNNAAIVAQELAKGGGQSMVNSGSPSELG